MVAAVSEPAGGVGSGDGGEGAPGGGTESIVGACRGAAGRLLDLREGVLDRVEVRRVGRQVPEPGAARFDGSPAVFTATGPGTGRRASPPVARSSRTQRSIVGT